MNVKQSKGITGLEDSHKGLYAASATPGLARPLTLLLCKNARALQTSIAIALPHLCHCRCWLPGEDRAFLRSPPCASVPG